MEGVIRQQTHTHTYMSFLCVVTFLPLHVVLPLHHPFIALLPVKKQTCKHLFTPL